MVGPAAGGASMNNALHDELLRFQRRWRMGLLVTGLYGAIFWAGVSLLVFGVIDYLAGFSDPARLVISTSLWVVAGAALLFGVWQLVVFVRRSAAEEADRALGSPRREILSALELSQEPPASAPLAAWLRQNAVS